MLRDIRELASEPDAYAAELRRRWGGLLSYRYIGRSYASMDLGPADDTVTLRHDMRNATGGILLAVLGIASPEGGGMSDLEAVPNPVIHSCQVLDPGRDVRRFEVNTEVMKRGRQMGYSRSRIVDADRPARVLALTEGQGISIGTPPEGLGRMAVEPIEVIDSPDLPPLWQVFGGHRRPDGHWALPELAAEVASPDAALHIGPQFVVLETAALQRAAEVVGTDRLQGALVARDVRRARQDRPVPDRSRAARRRAGHGRGAHRHARRGRRGPGDHRRVICVPSGGRSMTAPDKWVRSDDDEWDIVSSVGYTALLVAGWRALHAMSAQPLVRDDYAKHFITASADPYLTGLLADPGTSEGATVFPRLYGVQTRFFDEFFSSAADRGIRQAVIVAAGLDSRSVPAELAKWHNSIRGRPAESPGVQRARARRACSRARRPSPSGRRGSAR